MQTYTITARTAFNVLVLVDQPSYHFDLSLYNDIGCGGNESTCLNVFFFGQLISQHELQGAVASRVPSIIRQSTDLGYTRMVQS